MSFELTSRAFTQGADIPRRHTCDGEDASPALSWTGAPAGTKSFALIVDDPDAPVGTWVHWVLFEIPAEATALSEGITAAAKLADGTTNGTNDFKRLGYGGPCPPRGPAHRYFFKLFALDGKVGLPSGATKAQLEEAMQGHILGRAELMGRYGRR